jgi:hypothetical protein
MKLRSLLGVLLCLAVSSVWAEDDEDELKPWQELEATLPAFPKAEHLLPFVVSAATSNRFFVDSRSLNVDGDGVVRYVLVIETAGGARNVTFEGMRCETRERRIYASGRQGGEWSKSRKKEWVRIQDAYANRQHAALFLEYFCPFGNSVRSVAEARDALVRGGHPDVRR